MGEVSAPIIRQLANLVGNEGLARFNPSTVADTIRRCMMIG